MTGNYDDEYFENNQDVFNYLKPNSTMAFDLNSVPDCTIHMNFCKFWGETKNDEIVFNSDIDNNIVEILTKALPTACKSRELARIILQKLEAAYQKDVK